MKGNSFSNPVLFSPVLLSNGKLPAGSKLFQFVSYEALKYFMKGQLVEGNRFYIEDFKKGEFMQSWVVLDANVEFSFLKLYLELLKKEAGELVFRHGRNNGANVLFVNPKFDVYVPILKEIKA